jgi:hypothetical protein
MRSDLDNDKVDGLPKGVPLAIDLHEHLIQMRRAAPVSPQTNGLMANVNSALVKQVLDIS